MKIESIRVLTLSTPLDSPVVVSFGEMRHRKCILVRIEASNGIVGWGESWSNFPSWSSKERTSTIIEGLAPLLLGRDPSDVAALHGDMSAAFRTLALQWGAAGPLSQAISGVDIALWDLHAKALKQPLYRLLGGRNAPIPVYASGLGPKGAHDRASELAAKGFSAFKLKVGFGRERDEENLALLREAIGPAATLFVDANQAWDVITAKEMGPLLRRHDVAWLEEPLPCHDLAGMAEVRSATGLRLAAGENSYGVLGFADLLRKRAVDVLQPDVAKVGGLTEALRICGLAASAGVRYAPHYLGGGVGLLATMHLFAAAPGGYMLELDANPNPLRTEIAGAAGEPENGYLRLPDGPGLGIELDEERLAPYIEESLAAEA